MHPPVSTVGTLSNARARVNALRERYNGQMESPEKKRRIKSVNPLVAGALANAVSLGGAAAVMSQVEHAKPERPAHTEAAQPAFPDSFHFLSHVLKTPEGPARIMALDKAMGQYLKGEGRAMPTPEETAEKLKAAYESAGKVGADEHTRNALLQRYLGALQQLKHAPPGAHIG